MFGILVPDFNSVVEPELSKMRLPDVSNQTARFALDASVVENIAVAAERLSTCGIESWIVGLATDSFPNGYTLLDQGIEELRDRTGLPVHTASYAVHAALDYLGLRRIAIVTPFDEATNIHVRTAFEGRGYEVVAMAGLACAGFDQIASTPDEETLQAFASVAKNPVEGLVQVGTGLPMLHLIEELERRFDLPVVASNPASYWQGLRAAGITDVVPGAGRLLEANPAS